MLRVAAEQSSAQPNVRAASDAAAREPFLSALASATALRVQAAIARRFGADEPELQHPRMQLAQTRAPERARPGNPRTESVKGDVALPGQIASEGQREGGSPAVRTVVRQP